MRFLLIPSPASTDATPATEQPFDENVFIAHMKYNEEMYKAGVLVAAEGLNPNARGAHVLVSQSKRTVIDGPFAETKELIAGFYLIEVGSREEAIEWAVRYPGNFFGGDEVLEIRQLTGASDIPPHLLQLIHTAAPTWSASFSKSE